MKPTTIRPFQPASPWLQRLSEEEIPPPEIQSYHTPKVTFRRRNRPAVPRDLTSVRPQKPTIVVTHLALQKMQIYVEQCAVEISWYGTVDELGDRVYRISDVFLVGQINSSASTAIQTSPQFEFMNTQLARGEEGRRVINSTRFWGHSHHSMPVFASGQDEQAMRVDWKNIGSEYIIRGIFNKAGDVSFTVWYYQPTEEIFDYVPWIPEDSLVSDALLSATCAEIAQHTHVERPRYVAYMLDQGIPPLGGPV